MVPVGGRYKIALVFKKRHLCLCLFMCVVKIVTNCYYQECDCEFHTNVLWYLQDYSNEKFESGIREFDFKIVVKSKRRLRQVNSRFKINIGFEIMNEHRIKRHNRRISLETKHMRKTKKREAA